jgi:hypothetical protein
MAVETVHVGPFQIVAAKEEEFTAKTPSTPRRIEL